jgi:glucose/arabinose dehydrogenase
MIFNATKFFYLSILLPFFVLCYYLSRPDPSANLPHINSANFPATSPAVDNWDTQVIASGLDIPWEIVWGPDNKIWVNEQRGVVSRIDPTTGTRKVLLQLNDVWFYRTAGLLAMALHPDIKSKPYVYLNYTLEKEQKRFSRLVRYTWQKDTLINPKVLMEVAANNGHSGARIAFSKGKLFWATGDANNNTYAQNFDIPNGKILRLNTDGSIPADNPVKGSPVWAMGFRNIQGMVFSKTGKLYSSEHGDATDDEVNLVEATKNYGWPSVQGFANSPKEKEFSASHSTADPMKAWTPTIGPAGMTYYSGNISQWNNSLLLVSLKDKNLRSLKLSADGRKIINEEIVLNNQFGRLRGICVSPSGDIYVSTSNRDWTRTPGSPHPDDDRIIRIFKSGQVSAITKSSPVMGTQTTLYEKYCASCHRADASGLSGVFPPLKGSDLVKNGGLPLIRKIIKGSTGPVVIAGVKYDAQMPSFAFLKNNEIEDIANYILTLQTDKYPTVDPQVISKARND